MCIVRDPGFTCSKTHLDAIRSGQGVVMNGVHYFNESQWQGKKHYRNRHRYNIQLEATRQVIFSMAAVVGTVVATLVPASGLVVVVVVVYCDVLSSRPARLVTRRFEK